MAQLQIAFTQRIDIQNKLTSAKVDLKKILEDRPDYVKFIDEKRLLNNKLKQILQETAEEYPKLIQQIEALKVELKDQDELVSECAVRDYLEKKDITIKLPGAIYTPKLVIKFEKSEDQTLFDKK